MSHLGPGAAIPLKEQGDTRRSSLASSRHKRSLGGQENGVVLWLMVWPPIVTLERPDLEVHCELLSMLAALGFGEPDSLRSAL